MHDTVISVSWNKKHIAFHLHVCKLYDGTEWLTVSKLFNTCSSYYYQWIRGTKAVKNYAIHINRISGNYWEMGCLL